MVTSVSFKCVSGTQCYQGHLLSLSASQPILRMFIVHPDETQLFYSFLILLEVLENIV